MAWPNHEVYIYQHSHRSLIHHLWTGLLLLSQSQLFPFTQNLPAFIIISLSFILYQYIFIYICRTLYLPRLHQDVSPPRPLQQCNAPWARVCLPLYPLIFRSSHLRNTMQCTDFHTLQIQLLHSANMRR
jgi:hypothetical protein